MSPMPAKRFCAHQGCFEVVSSGRCATHGGPYPAHSWGTRENGPERISGSKLQALRRALFMREPLCRTCAAKGETALATIRDHIRPVAEGGTDDDSNIQPICGPCHQAKIEQESARGQRRAR